MNLAFESRAGSKAGLPEHWRRKHLSPAEQRVVELIGGGVSTKMAADHLQKSTLTVRNQLQSAMRKLGVQSRYELIVRLRPLAPAETPTENASEYLGYAI